MDRVPSPVATGGVAPWPEANPSVVAPVPEHEELREVVCDLLQTHASHERVRRSVASESGYSAELWRLLNSDMNVSALAVPEDRGGLGFGMAVLAVILEECGRALIPEPVYASAVLGAHAVANAPRGALPEHLIDGVLTGHLIATAAVRPVVDGQLVADERGTVTGVVRHAVHGAAAHLLIAPASTADGAGLFLIDLGGRGVSRSPLEVMDLTRRQARIHLDSAEAFPIAGPDEAGAAVSDLKTLGTVALAAEHVGMVEAMLGMTQAYLAQRHQFGRPLVSFQVIKHRLADMLVDLERARSAARYAAVAFDVDPTAARLPAAVAGAVCIDAVIRVALDTVQLHGGVGFTWEHPAHFYLRRALGDEAFAGPAREHRAEIARLIGCGLN